MLEYGVIRYNTVDVPTWQHARMNTVKVLILESIFN